MVVGGSTRGSKLVTRSSEHEFNLNGLLSFALSFLLLDSMVYSTRTVHGNFQFLIMSIKSRFKYDDDFNTLVLYAK